MEDDHSHSDPGSGPRLIPRERRVLELISEQFSRAEIGLILGVDANALDAIIKGIVKKMNAQSPSDAAMQALIDRLIGPNVNPR